MRSLQLQIECFVEISQLIETVALPCQCSYISSVVLFELSDVNGAFGEAEGALEGVKTSLGQICFVIESSFKTMEIG